MKSRMWVGCAVTVALVLGLALPASAETKALSNWGRHYNTRVIGLELYVAAYKKLPRTSTVAQELLACHHIADNALIDSKVPSVPNKKAEADWRKAIQELYAGGRACESLVTGQSTSSATTVSDLGKGGAALKALGKLVPVKAKKTVHRHRTTKPRSTAATTTSTSKSTTSGSGNGFGDGTWTIGTAPGDVAPGTYQTNGGVRCYWERASDLSGQESAVLANGNTIGHVVVTILPTDVGFQTERCGTWTRLPKTGPRATSFGNGIYAVGINIAPGTYTTSGGSACVWERSSDLTGDGTSIISDANTSGPLTLTIATTVKSFSTQGCGTWHHS
jgi:hypothetical protein